MIVPRQAFHPVSEPPTTAADYRQRMQRVASERAALRETELEAQASPGKDPWERIQIWERLHALRLPRMPGHVLVRVVARQTGLTIGQVHEEQRRRADVPAPFPPVIE